VLQVLKPWSARPPKLREPEPPLSDVAAEEGVSPSLVSTALSSQDGADDALEDPAVPSVRSADAIDRTADEPEVDSAVEATRPNRALDW
jgi:hypothetical protein